MAHRQSNSVGRFLQRLCVAHLMAAPDDELVERFAVHGEEAAFTALVRRHGPLVLGVCRRVLADSHAAEDCFQTTFLVLACKARHLRRPGAISSWLYGVAARTALKARVRAARRRRHEHRAAVAEAVDPSEGAVWRDVRPNLDAAIAGLSEKYRAPVILHYLEGLTVAEVAHRLGCPQGTAAARLARGRQQLRKRLTRMGTSLGAVVLPTTMLQGAITAVPELLAASTSRAAMEIAAGKAAGAIFATAAALLSGGLSFMSASKVKVTVAALVVVSVLGVGVGVSHNTGQGGRSTAAARLAAPGGRTQERFYAGGFHTIRGFEFRDSGEEGSTTAVPVDRELQDVLIRVQEQPTGSLRFGVGVNSSAGLTGSIILNERSFDVQRQPCSPECRGPGRTRGPLYLVAFVDGGTVEQTAGPQDGRSVELTVPMLGPAPVALDFGFPLVKQPPPPTQVFNFWMGFFS